MISKRVHDEVHGSNIILFHYVCNREKIFREVVVMSKHRSICSLFIICIMIFTFSYYVDADENGSNAPLGESCNVYFDVDFMENLFFNTYDLELYLDDTKIGTLAHGKPYTKMHSTTPGKHIITFYKDEDHSVKNSEDIEITKEGTLKCHVEAHSD